MGKCTRIQGDNHQKIIDNPLRQGSFITIAHLPMFFLQFHGTPRRNARTAPQAAGGIVNCWIERTTLDEAIRIARAGIRAEGWIIDEHEEAYPVDDATYPPGKDGREQFEQALIDKEVFVFYTFPEVDGE